MGGTCISAPSVVGPPFRLAFEGSAFISVYEGACFFAFLSALFFLATIFSSSSRYQFSTGLRQYKNQLTKTIRAITCHSSMCKAPRQCATYELPCPPIKVAAKSKL